MSLWITQEKRKNFGEKKKFWRKTIKNYIVEAFGGECQCCKRKFDNCCYDLHHLNPNEKDFVISTHQYNGAKSWLKIRDEVIKCCLVCVNCHRLIHNNIIKSPTENTFNNDYYDWNLTEYKQVNKDLIPIDDSIQDHLCPQCGQWKARKEAKLCGQCAHKFQKKFEVSREELKQLIRDLPFTKIGEIFGVSDNAIRNRCKTYNLPTSKKKIKSYSQEEWDNI